MRTRRKVSADFLSFPPCLPFWGMGGDKGRTISVLVLGDRMVAGKHVDFLQGSHSVLGSVSMRPESKLLVCSEDYKCVDRNSWMMTEVFSLHGQSSPELRGHHQTVGRLVLMETSEGFTENPCPVASGHCSPMCAPVQNALVQLS